MINLRQSFRVRIRNIYFDLTSFHKSTFPKWIKKKTLQKKSAVKLSVDSIVYLHFLIDKPQDIIVN